MKTSLRVLRCRLLSVFAFLALASSAQELHLGRGPVAMATGSTGSPAPDWHREGSSGGEWSHNASAADVADRPAATGSSPENRTFAGLPPTETAGTVTLPPGRPNATDSDLAEARSATAAPDRRGSAQYTAWTDDGRVPPATHDPRGANGSSGPAPDSTPSSRVAVCLSRMDVVWIVLAVGVPVSTCSVLLTVCCMRRRKKSSGQESNLSYWNNAITMDYFSRHAVELPREIHTLESEEHDSCLPPNGEYGAGSVVLVNPFCQESLFINRDKAAAT